MFADFLRHSLMSYLRKGTELKAVIFIKRMDFFWVWALLGTLSLSLIPSMETTVSRQILITPWYVIHLPTRKIRYNQVSFWTPEIRVSYACFLPWAVARLLPVALLLLCLCDSGANSNATVNCYERGGKLKSGQSLLYPGDHRIKQRNVWCAM